MYCGDMGNYSLPTSVVWGLNLSLMALSEKSGSYLDPPPPPPLYSHKAGSTCGSVLLEKLLGLD